MADAIGQSILATISPTDFDQFLDEIGFADVDGQDRIDLVELMKTSVEREIVLTVFSRLEPEKKKELARLMEEADKSGAEKPVNDWLLKEIPEVETLVDEAVDKVKNKLRTMSLTMRRDIEADVLSAEEAKKQVPKQVVPPQSTELSSETSLREPEQKPIEPPAGDPLDAALAQVETPNVSPPPPAPEPTTAPVEPFPWEQPADSSQAMTDELNSMNNTPPSSQ